MRARRRMRFLTILVGVLLVLIILPVVGHAQVPQSINYQGKLTDAGGNPLDGFFLMSFYLYDYEQSSETSIWQDESLTVEVRGGIYNVQLALTEDLFDGDELYLEVAIFNSGTDWETLSPRQRLTSTAFAMKAAKANDADALDGLDSADFADAGHGHSFVEITGTSTDAQVPDDITINHAATAGSCDTANSATSAGNANTVDGAHAAAFASTGHAHDGVYAPASHAHDDLYATKSQVKSLEGRIAQLEALLANVKRSGNDITFSGVNVHIENGSGATGGTVNSLGNLIVGYNELRGSGDDRTGSHNIVVGGRQNYSSWGGLVAGYENTISGSYASVSGGLGNTSSSHAASVSGGAYNTSSEYYASVSGGGSNTASGTYSSVSGGSGNTSSGYIASVSGGRNNTSSWDYASVSGGRSNTSSGNYASVSGGYLNTSSGNSASVSGGYVRSVVGSYDWGAGGLFEDN